MNFYKFLQGAENLLFEVLMGLLLFPITLYTVLRHPGALPAIVAREIELDSDQRFDTLMSPPLTLLVAGALVLPLPGSADGAAELSGALGKSVLSSPYSNLFISALLVASVPLAFTVIANRLVRAPISRSASRQPLYVQLWLISPLAFFLPLSDYLYSVLGQPWATLTGCLAAALVLRYLHSAYRWFRDTARQSRLRAVAAVGAGIATALILTFLAMLTLIDWPRLLAAA